MQSRNPARARLGRALPTCLLATLAVATPASAQWKLAAQEAAALRQVWVDFDGDGFQDLYTVAPGRTDVLLQNQGDGTFADVTDTAGLGGSASVLARAEDLDGDGRADLLLVTQQGGLRLFLGQGAAAFHEATEHAGLAGERSVVNARTLDFDGDGQSDLLLETGAGEPRLLRNAEGLFEPVELSLEARATTPVALSMEAEAEEAEAAETAAAPGADSAGRSASTSTRVALPAPGFGGASAGGPFPPSGSEELVGMAPRARTIQDQARPRSWIQASSLAELGKLYPLSTDLNVSGAGDVGIGTTLPKEKLHVEGNALADRLFADVPTGTAPLAVISRTKVNNLNVDRLDDLDSTDFRRSVDPIQLADLAADSVDSDKVVNDSIRKEDIGPNSVGFSELAPDSVGSVHVQLDTLTAADIAVGAIGASELQANAVSSVKIANGSILNNDVSLTAGIDGTKIDPDFGSQDLKTRGAGSFGGVAGFDPWQVKGDSANGPTRGYLGVQGEFDHDGIPTLDIDSYEIGVLGASTGNGASDNYALFGHSDGVALRAENSNLPAVNYAELGLDGIGIKADGATLAADLNGAVDISGDLDVLSTVGNAISFKNSSAATVRRVMRVQRTVSSGSGNDILQVEAQAGSSSGSQLIEAEIDADVKFRVDADGDVFCDGSFTGGGADFAEMIEVSAGASSVVAGDVLVIDPSGRRAVRRSERAYSRLVAGIYSTEPGFVGSERKWEGAPGEDGESQALKRADMAAAHEEIPLAIVGIVPCKVTSENGPILAGDLLVTSSTPGHAMVDNEPPVGTVVGKALESFDAESGTILVLVTLQ